MSNLFLHLGAVLVESAGLLAGGQAAATAATPPGTCAHVTRYQHRYRLDDGTTPSPTSPRSWTCWSTICRHARCSSSSPTPCQMPRSSGCPAGSRHVTWGARVIVFSFSRAEVTNLRAINGSLQTSLISDGNEATWTVGEVRSVTPTKAPAAN